MRKTTQETGSSRMKTVEMYNDQLTVKKISMQKLILYILGGLGLSWCLTACYKDKGNYNYKIPPVPVVKGLDSIYPILINDTLAIQPMITIAESSPRLGYQWRIDVPVGDSSIYSYGPKLVLHFTLPPQQYSARLTIIDSTNNMKYFFPFLINGLTGYSIGTVILSQESGVSELSFVAADGTLTPRVYHAINGRDLPGGATQMIALADKYVLPGTISSYWVMCSGPDDPGIQLDAATFLPIKSLKENFFTSPAVLAPGVFQGSDLGVLLGVANGKLYTGSNQTWNLSPTYGMFGLPATGDYSLHRQAAFNATFPYMLGYDSIKQCVVAFTNFGSAAYIGTSYQVTDTTAFNPKNVGLKLLDFEQINDQNAYAFGRTANDSIYEVKFGAAFMGIIQLSPAYKRPFPHPELITPQTIWGSAPTEVFYFSSGSVIYRYNPLNQSLQALTTDFGGKEITMLRMTDKGNTIMAGVDGSVLFLDVSTGKNGNITRRIDGIPGSPLDVTVRTE
jgi:hypothetical protein